MCSFNICFYGFQVIVCYFDAILVYKQMKQRMKVIDNGSMFAGDVNNSWAALNMEFIIETIHIWTRLTLYDDDQVIWVAVGLGQGCIAVTRLPCIVHKSTEIYFSSHILERRSMLTHLCVSTYLCVSAIIGSGNDSSPDRCQAIT